MRTLLCLFLLTSHALLAEERPPFWQQAAGIAPTLGAGAIATAEKRDGGWHFALAGEPFAAGHGPVPDDKVIFEIGSISKVFTGILLADAILDHQLQLDDTLAQRLPVKFSDPAVGAVTLKQLATHTSCLPRLPDNLTSVNDSDPYAPYDQKALFSYLAGARLKEKPPCDWTYSNLGYGILGTVLESVSGKPWAALVHERITGPLGMVDTVEDLSAEQRSRFALPWDHKLAAHEWTFKAFAGAGALRSTTADLSKLADALLAGAKGPLGSVWPLVAGDLVDVPFIGGKTGLGLNHMLPLQGDNEGDRYGHDGGTGGFRSIVEVWPGSGRAIVVLASNAEAAPIAWLASWQVTGDLAAPRTEITLPPASLEQYVGMYTVDQHNRFTILRRGNQLISRLSGQPFFPIFASGKDEFFYRAVTAQLSFHRSGAGRIDQLELHQNGNHVVAKRDPGDPPHVEFPDPTTLQDYLGEYTFADLPAGTTMKVSLSDGTLYALLTGQQPLPIFSSAKDRFDYDVVPATLTFERDGGGKVTALVLHQSGMELRASRK